jgi:hypothetical protein
MAQPICAEQQPALTEWLPERRAACHFALESLAMHQRTTKGNGA